MIDIKDKSNCCGCTACASVCAHNAITMKPDGLGFLYPSVDMSKCTNCGLCDKICAFNADYDKSLNVVPKVYAARLKDIHEVETSRSGAAFTAISEYVLGRKGVVYGAGYTDHFRVVHKRAATRHECCEFKGSKYVQSDLSGVFHEVRQDLKDGLLVLFSGTPCQTAGLNSFVGKKLRKNLILVDIVCHGVPGPYIWRDYISWLEKKHGATVTGVNFRNKNKYGWKSHIETFETVKSSFDENHWADMFSRDVMLRSSCYRCHYSNLVRPSDITIGDFWGWERADSGINKDDKGVSLLIVNTDAGNQLFDSIKEKMHVVPTTVENCLQPNLQHPSPEHPQRESFETDYIENGFEYVLKKYGKIDLVKRVKRWGRYALIRKVKQILHFVSAN